MSNKKRDEAQIEKAMRMYAEGSTYAAIADAIGLKGKSGAYNLVVRELKRRDAMQIERQRAEAQRDDELHTLESLINEELPKAQAGDLQATDRILSLLDRRAKILGLYPEEKGA